MWRNIRALSIQKKFMRSLRRNDFYSSLRYQKAAQAIVFRRQKALMIIFPLQKVNRPIGVQIKLCIK